MLAALLVTGRRPSNRALTLADYVIDGGRFPAERNSHRPLRCLQTAAAQVRTHAEDMFEVQYTDGKGRAGALSCEHGDINTPAPLLYSFRGSPLNSTPDIMNDLGGELKALHVTATELRSICAPCSLDDPAPEQVASGGGAHSFFGQQGRLLLASPRDPLRYNIHRWKNGRDSSLRVDTPKGHMDVTPARYMELLRAAQFDLAALLSDEVPCNASHRRSAQSVDKSLEWLQQALSQVRELGVMAKLIACIQGGPFPPERKRHAEGIVQHREVSGVMLGGLGTGEGSELRQELIDASLSRIPRQLPRIMAAGVGSPLEALDAVACGVDFVDASFAVHATSAGHALLLDPAEWRQHDAEEASAMPALESTPPSAMQPQAISRHECSQHAQRFHGKQRNPRNKPEVTMKTAHDSTEMPLPAASMAADDRQLHTSSGQDTAPVQLVEPFDAYTGSMGATVEWQAHGEAAASLGDTSKDRDAAEPAIYGRPAAALQLPASISKSDSLQNKRGLAEQAPSHVKHPRHRADCDQSPVDMRPASLKDAPVAPSHAGSAFSRRGRKGQKGSLAPGTQVSPGQPGPSGSQHALPASIALDMWKLHHRADSRPLSELCACSTCQRHSRAYVHHLLKTKEMLAQVLLETHNTHSVCQFFIRMRQAIVHGKLSALRSDIAHRM